MTRDEMFGRLTSVFSINVLHFLKLDILCAVRSMNRPRSKGKRHAIAIRKVIFSIGYKHMYKFDWIQLEDKVSR